MRRVGELDAAFRDLAPDLPGGAGVWLRSAVATALRTAYAAGVEDAAKVAAQYQCMNCGQRFLASEGHSDADCRAGHASWDTIPRDQLVAGIRALIPAKED